jgi:hypothetical protein
MLAGTTKVARALWNFWLRTREICRNSDSLSDPPPEKLSMIPTPISPAPLILRSRKETIHTAEPAGRDECPARTLTRQRRLPEANYTTAFQKEPRSELDPSSFQRAKTVRSFQTKSSLSERSKKREWDSRQAVCKSWCCKNDSPRRDSNPQP